MQIPIMVTIKKIITETPTVKTFIFDWEVTDEEPGQFMMVWNFKDEKPMSISHIDPVSDEIGLSIKKVGPFSEALHSLKEGDMIGMRGPYGRPFEMAGSNILLVGGGIGMAPLHAFAQAASRRRQNLEVISAAVNQEELLFIENLENMGFNVHTATDDGSCGFCGFPTLLADELMQSGKYDMLLSCGPEVMMKGLFSIAEKHGITCQFSLERYMKCALGICGQCCLDDTGWRVCAEGPVFWGDEIRMITEFGQYKRDSSGLKHRI